MQVANLEVNWHCENLFSSVPCAHTMHRYLVEQAIFVNFSQLILRKIIKIVATRCHILRLKWTNIFRLGLRPRPRWEFTAFAPDSLSGFKWKGEVRREGRSSLYFLVWIYLRQWTDERHDKHILVVVLGCDGGIHCSEWILVSLRSSHAQPVTR